MKEKARDFPGEVLGAAAQGYHTKLIAGAPFTVAVLPKKMWLIPRLVSTKQTAILPLQ